MYIISFTICCTSGVNNINTTCKHVMLGGDNYMYLQIARAGSIILCASLLSYQIIHWVCPLTAQGFLPSFIITECVRQPSKFLLWGLCPLTTPLCVCALGFESAINKSPYSVCRLSRLTTQSSNLSVSCCFPRKHPVSIVPFTARFANLFLFIQLESELMLNSKQLEFLFLCYPVV